MSQSPPTAVAVLRKAPTGIPGLDEITHGGLPAGRPTLVCGGPGSGKTLLGITFLVNGAAPVRRARRVHELRGERGGARPGRRLARLRPRRAWSPTGSWWSTTSTSIAARSRKPASTTSRGSSFGWNTPSTRSAPSASLLDTIESLFGGLDNEAILRAELRRLFRWLRERDLTVVITGERGETTLTRHGLEEYVTDAVIQLDHRVLRPDLDPPPPRRQVSRLASRHQRVSVPDRRGWRRACCP